MRENEFGAAFADVWCAIPKVVFSRTLDSVEGNARLAEASVAEEAAAALDATDKDVAIGGAGLAAAAIGLGLVDELRMLRDPVVVGGGTPFLPPDTVVRVISASPELSSSLDNLAASVERRAQASWQPRRSSLRRPSVS